MFEIKNINAFYNSFGSGQKVIQLPNGMLHSDPLLRTMHLIEEKEDITYYVDYEKNEVAWCLGEKVIREVERINYILSYTTEQGNYFRLCFDTFNEALTNYNIVLNEMSKFTEIYNMSITKEYYLTKTTVVWGV